MLLSRKRSSVPLSNMWDTSGSISHGQSYVTWRQKKDLLLIAGNKDKNGAQRRGKDSAVFWNNGRTVKKKSRLSVLALYGADISCMHSLWDSCMCRRGKYYWWCSMLRVSKEMLCVREKWSQFEWMTQNNKFSDCIRLSEYAWNKSGHWTYYRNILIEISAFLFKQAWQWSLCVLFQGSTGERGYIHYNVTVNM